MEIVGETRAWTSPGMGEQPQNDEDQRERERIKFCINKFVWILRHEPPQKNLKSKSSHFSLGAYRVGGTWVLGSGYSTIRYYATMENERDFEVQHFKMYMRIMDRARICRWNGTHK